MITDEQIAAANAAGAELIRTLPGALRAEFRPAEKLIVVDLNGGFSIVFSPERAQELAGAPPEKLSAIEITSSGLGLYFPALDADLWVPSLAAGRFGNDDWEADWTARHSRAA